MKTDDQLESSRRLEEYRLRHEREPQPVQIDDDPFLEHKGWSGSASEFIFGKPKPEKGR